MYRIVLLTVFVIISVGHVFGQEQEVEPKFFFRKPWIPINLPTPATATTPQGPMCTGGTLDAMGCMTCGANMMCTTPAASPGCYIAPAPMGCTPECAMGYTMGPPGMAGMCP